MSTAVTLGPGPEIVPLPDFIQFGLTALYQAKTQEDFDTAFDSFIAKNVKSITFNGQTLSRDQYKSKIRGEQPLANAASSVTFGGIVTESSDELTGFAGVFYTATFNVQLVIGAPPSKQVLQSSLNVNVQEDGSTGGVGDKRKVFSVDQVAFEQAAN